MSIALNTSTRFPRLRRALRHLLLSLGLTALVVAGLVIWGGPTPPPPMASFNNPFKSLDYATLPALQRYAGADGQALAYRHYPPAQSLSSSASASLKGSVTLIHGSSASSQSLHPLAQALSAAGYQVFTLDVRGHGESGPRGRLARIGLLEEDLVAFVRTVRPAQPATLAGFSSGGGFALRFAGSPDQALFDSYLLLAPFVGDNAPSQRKDSGGWVSIGLPRIIGLTMFNAVGLRAFNGLPTVSFALTEEARPFLTPEYDFNLVMNFRAERDYRANIQRVQQPVAVLAGAEDEAFYTDRYEAIFRDAGKAWPVSLLPGIAHIPLTLDPVALQAVVQQVGRLQSTLLP